MNKNDINKNKIKQEQAITKNKMQNNKTNACCEQKRQQQQQQLNKTKTSNCKNEIKRRRKTAKEQAQQEQPDEQEETNKVVCYMEHDSVWSYRNSISLTLSSDTPKHAARTPRDSDR